MTKEDQLQIAVMDYIRYQYPDVLAIHPANERKTSPQAGALLKRKGVTAGVPDILIFDAMDGYFGLAIELKVGKNKPTEAQKAFMQKLSDNNWKTELCHTFDAARYIIDHYFG